MCGSLESLCGPFECMRGSFECMCGSFDCVQGSFGRKYGAFVCAFWLPYASTQIIFKKKHVLVKHRLLWVCIGLLFFFFFLHHTLTTMRRSICPTHTQKRPVYTQKRHSVFFPRIFCVCVWITPRQLCARQCMCNLHTCGSFECMHGSFECVWFVFR